jgi:hypothetical protein
MRSITAGVEVAMRTFFLTALLGCAAMAFIGSAEAAGAFRADSRAADVVDLPLNHLYESPVGPLGLAPTAELVDLVGRRVRMRGYMVEEQDPLPGQFKLALLPAKLAEREDGPADDLPAATVVVHLAKANAQRVVRFDPHPLVVTGVLEVGPREEPDGRVSHVRLILDPDSPTETSHAT